ncbi:MAG: hypothetical protein JXR39_04690 [Marinilabiliaceae bacterium]|nr:hypothetical protein [Marinilabiliaceae bacterium]
MNPHSIRIHNKSGQTVIYISSTATQTPPLRMSKPVRIIIAALLLCLMNLSVHGQFNYERLHHYAEFDTLDADKLFFRIDNHNFFKNYEYFGDYTEGYTMLGHDLAPSFLYYAGNRVRLQVGAHLKKYSGEQDFSEIKPIISLHSRLTPHLDMIIGTLRGTVHHGMLEPILDPEKLYASPLENGLQFIYNSRQWHADTWINWEQFIRHGDNKPEKFTFGLSSTYHLLRDSAHWQISIPVQLLAAHTGGQISNFDEPMQSLANAAIGFEFSRKPVASRIDEIKWTVSGLGYKDLTKKSGLPFTTGKAFYTTLQMTTRQLQLMVGYYGATNYVAPRGSALFQSVSDYNPIIYSKHRNLATGKMLFTHQLYRDIRLGVMAEGYYDLDAGQLEYAYGVNLMLMPSWFLLKKAIN